MVLPPLLLFSPLMVRSASSRVSNHDTPISPGAHPSRRRFAAPQDEDSYAALSLAFNLSSVIRPAPSACAWAALSAALALPERMCAAIVSCSVQALSR